MGDGLRNGGIGALVLALLVVGIVVVAFRRRSP